MLAWYRRTRRDLPWRRSRDPYRIWVSEIMLQQTRVDVVIPYYERFLTRYPDVATLAAAPLEDVLHAWAGLGYYGRARSLHAAARQLVAQHAGRFPADVDRIVSLPGIGRYTAGAIASIAFARPAPIVDGNVARVFARWFGLDADPDSAAVRRQLWDWATQWAAGPDPGDANQSLMELGAVLCRKAQPDCDSCPVRADCAARRAGRQHELPRPRLRPAARAVQLEVAIVRRRGRILFVRRDSGRLLQEWWELPATHAHGASGARLSAALRQRLGIDTTAVQVQGRVRHTILQNRIDAAWFETRAARTLAAARGASEARPSLSTRRAVATPNAARPAGKATTRTAATPLANLDLEALEVRWIPETVWTELPVATLTRKILRAASALQHPR
jgi:A/G-specific adenine glycosylase